MDAVVKVALTCAVACSTEPHVQSLDVSFEPSTELRNQEIDLDKREELG